MKNEADSYVCGATKVYIMDLRKQLLTAKEEAQAKIRIMRKSLKIMERQKERAVRVLTTVTNTVSQHQGGYRSYRGCEPGGFDHGRCCGKTDFANELYIILQDGSK